MKKIVILDTSVGSLNQGDEIINYSIKQNWKELFECNYIIRIATHTPMYTAFQSLIYKEKLSVIKNADYKFLCGTNALYTNMLRPLPTWNINLFDCGLARNTIGIGVGIGENSKSVNWYTKILYSKVLSKKYVHSVRDEKTQRFLTRLGYKAINTGCPTLWGLTKEHCRKIPESKGENVIFTLTYYERDIVNDKAMIDILLKNYKKVYFWPQCIKDLDYLESMDFDGKISVVSPNLDSFDQILNIESLDYVGNRLHGGIFALQHKCRTIIIAIDYRAREMNKTYSFECIEREKICDELERKINSAWKTEISGIDFNKIEAWKRQFEYE